MKKFILIAASVICSFIGAGAQSLQEGLRAIDFEKYEAARNIFKKLVQTEI